MRSYRVGVALLSLAFGTAATLAAAGESPDDRIEELIVTARRMAEPDWKVPLAISIVSGEEIERRRIYDLTDLVQHVPGLSYSYGRGQGGTPIIRAMAATNFGSNQNNVATLIDGVYISNAYAIDASMLDLANVTVLRGPQNALIGRNAFAGAISYQTEQPSESRALGAQADFGSDSFYRQSLYASGALSGTLEGRIAAMYKTFDGTIGNLASPPNHLGGGEQSAVTGTLLWRGQGDLSAKLTGYWFDNKRDATPRFAMGPVPPLFNCGRSPTTGEYINYCGQFPAPEWVDISPDAEGLRSQTVLGRLEMEQRWSFATVTSLTAFVQTRLNDGPDDWDLSSSGELLPVALASAPDVITRYQLANVYFSGFPLDDHEWSEELRLSGIDGRLRWLAGLYWADNRSLTHVGFAVDGRALAPSEIFVTDAATTNTPLSLVPYGRDSGANRFRAAFGSLSYALSTSLDVRAELRRSEERISTQAQSLTGGPPDAPQSGNWAFTTPRFTLEYTWPQQLETYLSAAKGARSGGFNDSPLPSEAKYGAETNWTYEVGMKTSRADRRVSVSADLYWVDWSNMQLSENSLDPTFPFPVIRNLGTVTVKGAELALAARPSHWLDLHLQVSYARARFGSGTIDRSLAGTCTPEICQLIPAPPSGQLSPDIGGNQLPGAPETAGTLAATFHGNVHDGLHWYARADIYAASRAYVRTDNLNWLGAQRIPSASVGLTGQRWELSLWGRNLNSTLRSDHAALATTDSGTRQFVVDRANGASWGMAFAYHYAGAQPRHQESSPR